MHLVPGSEEGEETDYPPPKPQKHTNDLMLYGIRHRITPTSASENGI